MFLFTRKGGTWGDAKNLNKGFHDRLCIGNDNNDDNFDHDEHDHYDVNENDKANDNEE